MNELTKKAEILANTLLEMQPADERDRSALQSAAFTLRDLAREAEALEKQNIRLAFFRSLFARKTLTKEEREP